jgi:hypothetical protein
MFLVLSLFLPSLLLLAPLLLLTSLLLPVSTALAGLPAVSDVLAMNGLDQKQDSQKFLEQVIFLKLSSMNYIFFAAGESCPQRLGLCLVWYSRRRAHRAE